MFHAKYFGWESEWKISSGTIILSQTNQNLPFLIFVFSVSKDKTENLWKITGRLLGFSKKTKRENEIGFRKESIRLANPAAQGLG